MEGVLLFSRRMNIDTVMDWIDGMENHFECEGVSEAEKVKVAKSRLIGSTLTWWKYLKNVRISMGKTPIVNWKAMITKVKENFLPEDFEIQLHKRRKGLRKKDLDVTSYAKEFQRLCLRSK